MIGYLRVAIGLVVIGGELGMIDCLPLLGQQVIRREGFKIATFTRDNRTTPCVDGN